MIKKRKNIEKEGLPKPYILVLYIWMQETSFKIKAHLDQLMARLPLRIFWGEPVHSLAIHGLIAMLKPEADRAASQAKNKQEADRWLCKSQVSQRSIGQHHK